MPLLRNKKINSVQRTPKEKNPKVAVFLGSDSDLDKFQKAKTLAKSFHVDLKINIASAHRSPDFLVQLLESSVASGSEVIIAGAGAAAHLAGVIASHTTLPVVGVPINSSPLLGLDSLLSTAMMPSGIPVACMAVGETGAKNAVVYAAQILFIKYPKIKKALENYRKGLANSVKLKNAKINR